MGAEYVWTSEFLVETFGRPSEETMQRILSFYGGEEKNMTDVAYEVAYDAYIVKPVTDLALTLTNRARSVHLFTFKYPPPHVKVSFRPVVAFSGRKSQHVYTTFMSEKKTSVQ